MQALRGDDKLFRDGEIDAIAVEVAMLLAESDVESQASSETNVMAAATPHWLRVPYLSLVLN